MPPVGQKPSASLVSNHRHDAYCPRVAIGTHIARHCNPYCGLELRSRFRRARSRITQSHHEARTGGLAFRWKMAEQCTAMTVDGRSGVCLHEDSRVGSCCPMATHACNKERRGGDARRAEARRHQAQLCETEASPQTWLTRRKTCIYLHNCNVW